MRFPKRLKELRIEAGLNQEELGEKINLTKANVSKYETGRIEPNIETITFLAKYFNVSIDYLLGKSDSRNNENNKPQLSEKDEKDIAKHLEETMKLLEEKQDSIMFDGEAIDEETKELLRQSLENSMRMAKAMNKKYTPKKYRK